MWGNWDPYTLLMGMTYGVATLENSLMVSYVHTQMAALFSIAVNWKKLKLSSTDEQINKIQCIQ